MSYNFSSYTNERYRLAMQGRAGREERERAGIPGPQIKHTEPQPWATPKQIGDMARQVYDHLKVKTLDSEKTEALAKIIGEKSADSEAVFEVLFHIYMQTNKPHRAVTASPSMCALCQCCIERGVDALCAPCRFLFKASKHIPAALKKASKKAQQATQQAPICDLAVTVWECCEETPPSILCAVDLPVRFFEDAAKEALTPAKPNAQAPPATDHRFLDIGKEMSGHFNARFLDIGQDITEEPKGTQCKAV